MADDERIPGGGTGTREAPSSFVFEQFAVPVEPMPSPEPGGDPEQEAAQLRQSAQQQGFEQGFEQGMQAGQAELQAAAMAFVSARQALDVAAAEQADAVERRAIELALKLAEKIVGGAVAVEPERVLDAIRGALRRLSDRAHVTVLVNPADLDLVRDSLTQIANELGAIERIEAQAERRVARGGVVLRTAVGEIDATTEGQVERAREVVERELGGPLTQEADEEEPVAEEILDGDVV